MSNSPTELKKLYAARFEGEKIIKWKNEMWHVLCKSFFQKFIGDPGTARIADVAAGYCEFINNIRAKDKYAVDLNPDSKSFAGSDVNFAQGTIADLLEREGEEKFDYLMMSNFLEHLDSKRDVQEVISTGKRLLKKGGQLFILQPNIKYVGGQYWDFFDHKTPLTEASLIELSQILNMKVVRCIKKFLPYTSKSSLPKSTWIIWLYIKLMPLSGMLFGSQSFLVLERID